MNYVVDTCIFNKLVKGTISLDILPQNSSYFASHIQIDELNNTPDATLRVQLSSKFEEIIPERIPTESMAWGTMRWGRMKWSDGELYNKLKQALDKINKSKPNNVNDVLIAETAIKNGYALLTSDRDLAKVADEFGCNVHLIFPATAIILSGGLARRMNGANKAMLSLQNKPLIAHVIERITPQVSEVLINANQNAASFAPFNLAVLPDLRAGFPGPLAGMEAGLQHIQNTKSEYLLTLPCDSPLVPKNLVIRLQAGLKQANADIAVATSDGTAHPVFCLMKKSVLPSLQAFLDEGERKVSTWQKSQAYTEVDLSDNPDGFINLNTLEDLASLELKLHL